MTLIEAIKSAWRSAFPHYKCKWCRDRGILESRYAVSVCTYCRDINAEVNKAAREFMASIQKAESAKFAAKLGLGGET